MPASAQTSRVMASGGQDVNHLDEEYEIDGRIERPDILDNAFVIVEYERGARAMLDLCMFAEASRNEQEISVVGHLGKVEALISEGIASLTVSPLLGQPVSAMIIFFPWATFCVIANMLCK